MTEPTSYQRYVPPEVLEPEFKIANLQPYLPFQWLFLGFKDLIAHWGIALFYGVSFWMMYWILMLIFKHQPEYTMSIISGCLLVGPFLTMGLYEVSRRRETGETNSLGASASSWEPHIKSMSMLVLVLIVLELLWGRASLVVFAVFFDTGFPSTSSVIEAVFNQNNLEFVMAYTMVGGIFAFLVFSSSVVSIPLILDRDSDAISACITSIRVVLKNPLTMLVWGSLLTILVIASLLPKGLGIILVGPWLGHATWYAYKSAVNWKNPALKNEKSGLESSSVSTIVEVKDKV